MKSFILLLLFTNLLFISAAQKNTALLIVDIQNFYFPGGDLPLVEPEKAADNSALLLDYFRKNKMLVVHVKHNYEPGGDINLRVKPIEGEKVITKNYANSFRETDLNNYLEKNKIDTLVICGMQTHMCAEAATRAATDFGYKCIFVADACATRDLTYGDYTVKAKDVHISTLASLKAYAKVVTTNEFLEKRK